MGSSGFVGAGTAVAAGTPGSLALGSIIAFMTTLDTLACVNLASAGVDRSKLVSELLILAMMISSGKPAATISTTASFVRISWPIPKPTSSNTATIVNTTRFFIISALLRKYARHQLRARPRELAHLPESGDQKVKLCPACPKRSTAGRKIDSHPL